MFLGALKKVHTVLCGLFMLLVAGDQLVKYIVVNGDMVDYYCNEGVAFGAELPQIVFLVLWFVIVAVISYFWWSLRSTSFSRQVPFVLILSGGIANSIDRMVYGCVIDYIPFLTISSFNFADTLISFGAFLWIRQSFLQKGKSIDG